MSDQEAAPAAASTEVAAPAVPTGDRDALIAAVEAAKAAAPAEEPTTKEAPAKDEPKAAAEADAPKSKVAAVLRAREEAKAARDEAAQVREEAAAAKAEIAAMRAEAEKDRAEAKAERDRIQKLKTSPLAAIKELGWDHKQLVDEVVREGTPEWQAQKRYEQQFEAMRAELDEHKAFREEQKANAAKMGEEQAKYARHQTEQRFLGMVPPDSPIRSMFAEAARVLRMPVDRLIIQEAHRVADEYREKSKGQVASLEEVRDYLEHLAQEVTGSHQRQGADEAATGASKVASQPKASGPRALSGSAASERRASPKPRHQWTPQEEREALKAAAEAAMAQAAKQ